MMFTLSRKLLPVPPAPFPRREGGEEKEKGVLGGVNAAQNTLFFFFSLPQGRYRVLAFDVIPWGRAEVGVKI
jgi:hypothetical protein